MIRENQDLQMKRNERNANRERENRERAESEWNRTVSAVATVRDGIVTGSQVFSNDPENPEGIGRFYRELESMFTEPNETVLEPKWFADRDPVPANRNRNRAREREEMERNRTLVWGRSPKVPDPVPGSQVPERDGIHNPTHSVSIGIGSVPIADIGKWVSGSLGKGYGFQLFEHLGYWEGIPERSATIVFQGTRERFAGILRVLSINLPAEQFAHVTETNPKVSYFNMEHERERLGPETVLAEIGRFQ